MRDATAGARTKASFEAFVREHLAGLYGLGRRLAGNGAEDLVQETLLRAIGHSPRCRNRRPAARASGRSWSTCTATVSGEKPARSRRSP